jgi:hypothetical protein
MTTIAPIRYSTTAEQADKVARVVALTGCYRDAAWRYLDAAYGDVLEACESWRIDHRHFDMPAFPHRAPVPLEASE